MRESKCLSIRLVNKLLGVDWRDECLLPTTWPPSLHMHMTTCVQVWLFVKSICPTTTPAKQTSQTMNNVWSDHTRTLTRRTSSPFLSGLKTDKWKCDDAPTITHITIAKSHSMGLSCLICSLLPILTSSYCAWERPLITMRNFISACCQNRH